MELRYVSFVFLLCICFNTNLLFGQEIKESPEISDFLKQYAQKNKQSEFLNGWRIQILATTDRLALENAKDKFLSSYPNVPFQVVHNRPYYHLRVGAFYDKKEAILMKYFFRQQYPGAMEIADSKLTLDLFLASQF